MRIGSLFSGIGGLELGLEWAGVGHTIWQVERDSYASSILAKHWPDAVRFDDVCTVGAHNLPSIDLICGGFPCQDVSAAGLGAGLGGSRSGLWHEYARIIDECNPAIIVVENVASGARRWMPRVRSDLLGYGYHTRAFRIAASDVGAPHQRARIFVIAHRDRTRMERSVSLGSSGEVGQWQWGGEADLHAIADAPFRTTDRWPQPLLRAMDDGVPDRVARLRALGNAVVPQVTYVVGRIVMQIAECGA